MFNPHLSLHCVKSSAKVEDPTFSHVVRYIRIDVFQDWFAEYRDVLDRREDDKDIVSYGPVASEVLGSVRIPFWSCMIRKDG